MLPKIENNENLEVSKSKVPKPKMLKNVIIIVIFCIVIGACIIGLNVAKTQVPYTDSECNNVQVPYSSSECNNVQVPYSTQDCKTKNYAYNVVTTTCTQYDRGIIFSDPATVVCRLNNLEKQPGVFTITYGFYIAGQPVKFSDSVNVYAMGYIERLYTYNGQRDYCICSAIPPQYQDCQNVIRYKTESQCHDVTKYRTDEQCHNVTKYRTISVWQSLLG
jgi:hypothetical protein